MSLASDIAGSQRVAVCVGNGLAFRVRRVSPKDLRALGNDVVRGVQVGMAALQQARTKREAEQSGYSDAELERRQSGQTQQALTSHLQRLMADTKYREDVDALASAYVCAAVVEGARCPAPCPADAHLDNSGALDAAALAACKHCQAWSVGQLDDQHAASLDWEPIELVDAADKADHSAGRLYVADALTLVQRQVVFGVVQGLEVTPPTVRSFRSEAARSADALPYGEALRMQAQRVRGGG